MAKYIELDAAIAETLKPRFTDAELRRRLANIPAADVAPVRYGHWIDYQKGKWIYAKCSECSTVHDTKTNYCPNCGAIMIGVKNERQSL